MYIVQQNFILRGMYYYTKAQLLISAIKFGHLQAVHKKLMNRLYQSVWGALWDMGRLGARQLRDLVCVRGRAWSVLYVWKRLCLLQLCLEN
jgi:hypothetical protein